MTFIIIIGYTYLFPCSNHPAILFFSEVQIRTFRLRIGEYEANQYKLVYKIQSLSHYLLKKVK